jgi:hypothetical protein
LGKAIRDGTISMAESIWYEYAKKLGYSESRKPEKKRKKSLLNASRPNETWHKIFHNTKPWIMLPFTFTPWLIISQEKL